MYACMYNVCACMHVCVRICVYAFMRMCACMCVCVHMCIYVYVCMHNYQNQVGLLYIATHAIHANCMTTIVYYTYYTC